MKEQRKFHGLRAHIDDLLNRGWTITSREPLLLKRGRNRLQVCHGMLTSYD